MTTPDGHERSTERWQRVKRLLHEALEFPRHDRGAFLAAACGDDLALRDELQSLLDVEDAVFLDRPAFDDAARALEATRAAPRRERIDAWRIVRELGRGGMGTVYLAERDDGEYLTRAAIKVIRQDMDSELVVRRFRTERQILAGLDHPNVGRLLDGGTTGDGLPYFVMEYVDGEPIDQFCTRRTLTLPERLALFRSVCAAVQYAHQRLVVHRDIKPANVLVTADGVVKLLDFGIARVLEGRDSGQSTLHAMTPDYASPEQRARRPVTTLSDVWSLGVLLHEVLTGDRPPLDEDPSKPSDAVRNTAPGLAKLLRGDLDNIVQMAMRAEPERRYSSAAALSEDIRRHVDGLPVFARADTLSYRTTKFVRRNRVGVAAAVIVALNLVAGIVATTWQARVAKAERQRAERRFGEVRELATGFLFELDSLIATLPGATPAREALVTRALGSLDGLARDATNTARDRSLLRDLAAAYQRVGDVQGKPYSANLGHTEQAVTSYRKSIAILEQLRRTAPTDPSLMRDHARTLQLASAVEARAGDVEAGVAAARRAAAICDSALSIVPADTAFRALLASDLVWLGRALYQRHAMGSAQEAVTVYRRARSMQDSLLRLTPRDPMRRYTLAMADAYEAYGLWDLGDLTGDTVYYRDALGHLASYLDGARESGPRLPSRIDMRRASVDALHEMAELHVKLSESKDALRELQEAMPVTVSLAAIDEHNAEAQRDLASLHGSFATAYASAGDWTHSVRSARIASGILDRLYARDSTSADDLQSRSMLRAIEARAHRAVSETGKALASYEEARVLARRWARLAAGSDGPRRLLAAHDAAIAELVEHGSGSSSRAVLCDVAREAVAQWRDISERGPLAPADSTPAARARALVAGCGVTQPN